MKLKRLDLKSPLSEGLVLKSNPTFKVTKEWLDKVDVEVRVSCSCMKVKFSDTGTMKFGTHNEGDVFGLDLSITFNQSNRASVKTLSLIFSSLETVRSRGQLVKKRMDFARVEITAQLEQNK